MRDIKGFAICRVIKVQACNIWLTNDGKWTWNCITGLLIFPLVKSEINIEFDLYCSFSTIPNFSKLIKSRCIVLMILTSDRMRVLTCKFRDHFQSSANNIPSIKNFQPDPRFEPVSSSESQTIVHDELMFFAGTRIAWYMCMLWIKKLQTWQSFW